MVGRGACRCARAPRCVASHRRASSYPTLLCRHAARRCLGPWLSSRALHHNQRHTVKLGARTHAMPCTAPHRVEGMTQNQISDHATRDAADRRSRRPPAARERHRLIDRGELRRFLGETMADFLQLAPAHRRQRGQVSAAVEGVGPD